MTLYRRNTEGKSSIDSALNVYKNMYFKKIVLSSNMGQLDGSVDCHRKRRYNDVCLVTGHNDPYKQTVIHKESSQAVLLENSVSFVFRPTDEPIPIRLTR